MQEQKASKGWLSKEGIKQGKKQAVFEQHYVVLLRRPTV
jgi:hypothetical protein